MRWASSRHGRCRASSAPSCFGKGAAVVGALKNGFCSIDLEAGTAETIVDPEPDRPDNILNDGKCDRRGRYWCGSRDGALTNPVGALHRLDPDLSCRRMDDGFIVSNGIAWSPDDRTMYFADSRGETVWAYDFDLEEGAIRNRRVFFSTHDIEGRCDGATVDAEGFYWCALVHGGAVARFDPKGRMDRRIALPVKHPTMCSFGGDGLDTLFVTSAASMVPEAERKGQPLAGALFAIRGLGVKGLPETAVRRIHGPLLRAPKTFSAPPGHRRAAPAIERISPTVCGRAGCSLTGGRPRRMRSRSSRTRSPMS
jgi:sugar lactone lactonase YvrE